ncbi:caspase, EACC1-associated type [Microbispora amethystogenes]|uniref:caspase, EACC1-associated type n=1 Tax=Microbispora amethystogenes TaxID=1427754 RepID=UPI003CD0B141
MAIPDPARSRLILIGFSSFVDFARIPAAPTNLRRLKTLFCDEMIWGIPGRNVAILDGTRGLGRNAILSRIHEVAGQATDTLVVYYVGHGFLDEDDDDSLLLALPGTKRREHFTALPYEEIRRAVRGAGSRRKVVILDCCYSGRAHSDAYLDGSEEDRELAHQTPIEGACVLTATSDYARARANPGDRHTAFSGALISALENGIPGAGPYLDVRSVFAALRREMLGRGLPRPHLSTRDDGGALVLGRNRAYRGPAEAPPKGSEIPPPRAEPVPRRTRPRLTRRAAVVTTALVVVTVVVITVSLLPRVTARFSATGACPAAEPGGSELSRADRPGRATRFPESRISLLRDLTGPTTVIGFEPPRGDRPNPRTYLWRPDLRCFAAPVGFGSDYLDVAVSPDGRWIAGVDMRAVPGADVVVMDRAGMKKKVIDVPATVFATNPQWNRTSTTLLFTEAPVDARGKYTYPRGASAVLAGLPAMKPTVLALGATAPYQWGPDGSVAGNFGQEDPLDVGFFSVRGRRKQAFQRVGLLGQYGMGAFSPSEERMVTHCPRGPHDDQVCVWDARRGALLGAYPANRLYADRPYGNVGWYDERSLLTTAWDAKTNWWAAATLDITGPEPGTVAGRTTLLGRLPDEEGHIIFGFAPA